MMFWFGQAHRIEQITNASNEWNKIFNWDDELYEEALGRESYCVGEPTVHHHSKICFLFKIFPIDANTNNTKNRKQEEVDDSHHHRVLRKACFVDESYLHLSPFCKFPPRCPQNSWLIEETTWWNVDWISSWEQLSLLSLARTRFVYIRINGRVSKKKISILLLWTWSDLHRQRIQ